MYVYKRDIRDKRIAINALGSVITMFAESDEGHAALLSLLDLHTATPD